MQARTGEKLKEGKLKILLIEDNESNAEIFRFFLEREGYQVELATDGRVAARMILSTSPPDAVLLDISLPFVDGFQLITSIRRTSGWKHVPVVMLSGHSHERYIDHAISVGANEYLVKPFQCKELVQSVRRLIGT
jgi:DNA-binding response OmpR family regulator